MATKQDQTIEMVKLVMRVKGMTFVQLAEKAGVKRGTLQDYFKDGDKRARMTVDMLDKLAQALGTPIGLLLSESPSEVLQWLAAEFPLWALRVYELQDA